MITLEPIGAAHITFLASMAQDPAIRKAELLGPSDVPRYIHGVLSMPLLRVAHLGGEPIGITGFVDHSDLYKSARVPINMAPGFRGRGLGRLTVQTAVLEGFSMGFHRLWQAIPSWNTAMARTSLAAGFEQEGYLREACRGIDGKWHDVRLMAILNKGV